MAEVKEQQGKMTTMWFGFVDWVDERFPLTETFEYHMSKYYAPKNFNFFYYMGWLSMIVLVLQIFTGIWLTMNYSPTDAFASAVASVKRTTE